MQTRLAPDALTAYIARQLELFFPDGTEQRPAIERALGGALARLETAMAAITIPSFQREGAPFFDHLFSDQYAMFLYLLSNEAGCQVGERDLATKLYLLNKALHSIDVYFEVKLPRIFLFAHPLGTVLGRADYSDFFMVMQNCTVGNIEGVFPKLGSGVVLCAGASVLGSAELGEGVTVGAGSLVVSATVPPRHNVTGRGGEIKMWAAAQPMWERYFRCSTS